MQPHQILNAIADLPRINLAHKNTPFEEMPRLRAAIAESMDADISAVPPLFIKRDDTTGFAFGGNKARHMEFLFAHLIERGIDTIININHYDSNNARLAAAASAKTGMKYHWVAFDELDAPIAGNMLIAHLTGANIHRIPKDATRPYAESLLAQETNLGRNPTILLDNPFSQIAGMIAYLETAHEIDTQITEFSLSNADTGRGGIQIRPQAMPTPNPSPLLQEGVRGRPSPSLSEGDADERSETAGDARGGRDAGFPPLAGEMSEGQRGPNSPIHFWGLCGRSIAGIKLYARNTGKPWTATAVAQPHYTPENYQEIYLDRSTRVANPPRFRHPPKTQRHHHPNRLRQNLRHPNPSRHRNHAPSSRHRIHHPRPNLHRQINVRPNRRNPPRQPRLQHPHNLHPLRRPTPNLRLPQPNLEPQQPTVGATLVVAQARRRQKPPLRVAKGTRSAANAGDARRGRVESAEPTRHSRKPPSFPRTREPKEKLITPFTLPFAKRRGRGAKRTQGMPVAESSPFPNLYRHSRKPPSFPRTREPREKQIKPFTLPFAKRRGRGAKRTQGMHGAESSPLPHLYRHSVESRRFSGRNVHPKRP